RSSDLPLRDGGAFSCLIVSLPASTTTYNRPGKPATCDEREDRESHDPEERSDDGQQDDEDPVTRDHRAVLTHRGMSQQVAMRAPLVVGRTDGLVHLAL